MSTLLFRRDPALRLLLPICLGSVFMTLILFGFLHQLQGLKEVAATGTAGTTGTHMDIMPISMIAGLLVIAAMLGGDARTRVTELQLALPVSARTWVGLRASALLVLGWAPLLVSAGLGSLLIGDAPTRNAFLGKLGMLGLFWSVWVTWILAVRPARPRMESSALFIGLGVATFVLAAIADEEPRFGLVVGGLALAIGIPMALRGVPATMTLVSSALSDTENERGRAARAVRSPLTTWIARRTLLRVPTLVLLLALASFGAIVWCGGAGIFAYTIMIPFFGMGLMDWSSQLLREVGHLPVSRQRLAPWVLLPPIAALAGGIALSELWRGSAGIEPRSSERIDLLHSAPDDEAGRQRVQVPGHLQRLVWGREPLPVTSPAGETALIRPTAWIPGLPFAVWNPYDIERASSPEFLAWQLSRALRDAYGYEVSPEQLREEHVSVLNGKPIAPYIGLKLEEEAGPFRIHPPRSMAALGLFFALLLWAGFGWFALAPNTPPKDVATWRRARQRRWIRLGVVVLLGIAFLGLPFLHLLDGNDRPDLRTVLAGALETGPLAGTWTLAALLLGTGALIYVVLARRFARREVPPARPAPRLG